MEFFELGEADISLLNDTDLRELVGRLCEAEVVRQQISPSCVVWGGAQEAPDGGIDVRVNIPGGTCLDGFVPRNNTGFQVKKHSISKAGCKDEMQKKGCVRPAIAKLANNNGAYIIVSGGDNCSDTELSNRIDGMKESIVGIENQNSLMLDFYDKNRLTTWLRQYPGVALWVRSRIGKPLSGWQPYGRWAVAPVEDVDEFLFDDHPCIYDMSSQQKDPMSLIEGISIIREKLRRPGGIVRIIGLSGVGKTRFAQALFEDKVGDNALSPVNVVYADLGDFIIPPASELASYLIKNDQACYLILDNCPPLIHRNLQKHISQSSSKLSLLTIEYDISDDHPEETDVIRFEPCSEEMVSRLIKNRFSALGESNSRRIAEFSGGNARIALALASRVSADESLSSFSDEELFNRLFTQRKDNETGLYKSAEVLSLVYSFNISNMVFNDELTVLGLIGGIERSDLYRNYAELQRRQLVQARGDWRAILPHAIANRLAKHALQNIAHEEINEFLFKVENRRLLDSCAHRVGYLHNFEPALRLAHSWLQPGGPLYDITSESYDLLSSLEYITPCVPKIVLQKIEDVSKSDSKFASRENPSFPIFIKLLYYLAYEEEDFERAVNLLVNFAYLEKIGENANNIVSKIKPLFGLFLSDTQASPHKRLCYIEGLLSSNDQRYMEIAYELLDTALEASYWGGAYCWNIGARVRNHGWWPKSDQDKVNWYSAFIGFLRSLLSSDEIQIKKKAKKLFTDRFSGLWRFSGCLTLIEDIIQEYGLHGSWPELWISIKSALLHDSKDMAPESLNRLQGLESLCAPSDLSSRIETYVFRDTWRHRELINSYNEDNENALHEMIMELGQLINSEPKYLDELLPRLLSENYDAIGFFGAGIARGSNDTAAVFTHFLEVIALNHIEVVNPCLLTGYINDVFSLQPFLARRLQEKAFEITRLKSHFIALLWATPMSPWSIAKLIDFAESKEFEASQFEFIAYGRRNESISDDDLARLLTALNKLDNGFIVSLEILEMRFLLPEDSGHQPVEDLLSSGREAIRLFILDQPRNNSTRQVILDRVINQCLSFTAPIEWTREVIDIICDDIRSNYIHCLRLEQIVDTLIINFPEIVLDCVFKNKDKEDILILSLFMNRVYRRYSPVNHVPIDRLLAWCEGRQDRIKKLSLIITPFVAIDENIGPTDEPAFLQLSSHIIKLLDVIEDKECIIESIYLRIEPTGVWSGTYSSILKKRLDAFSKLINYPSQEVQEIVGRKIIELNARIDTYRKKEATEDYRSEQSFE